jgi:hypothetical protein
MGTTSGNHGNHLRKSGSDLGLCGGNHFGNHREPLTESRWEPLVVTSREPPVAQDHFGAMRAMTIPTTKETQPMARPDQVTDSITRLLGAALTLRERPLPKPMANDCRRLIGTIHGIADQARWSLPASTVTAHDGYPSTASGADRAPGGSSELTSVESAVHARLGDFGRSQGNVGHAQAIDEVHARLVEAGGAVRLAIKAIDQLRVDDAMTELHDALRSARAASRALGVLGRAARPPKDDRVRCCGDTGEAHSVDWADATCTNVAESDTRLGLCCSCRQRRSAAVRALAGSR